MTINQLISYQAEKFGALANTKRLFARGGQHVKRTSIKFIMQSRLLTGSTAQLTLTRIKVEKIKQLNDIC